MTARVSLVKGLHLTASDKRNIRDGIEYLRTQSDYEIWLGRPKSRKKYQITPHPETEGHFCILMREVYTADCGERRERTYGVTVAVSGIDPLPHIECRA